MTDAGVPRFAGRSMATASQVEVNAGGAPLEEKIAGSDVGIRLAYMTSRRLTSAG